MVKVVFCLIVCGKYSVTKVKQQIYLFW